MEKYIQVKKKKSFFFKGMGKWEASFFVFANSKVPISYLSESVSFTSFLLF